MAETCQTIGQLAQSCASQPEFYYKALAIISQAFNSPYAKINVRLQAGVVDNYHHNGPTDPKFWQEAVSSQLNDTINAGREKLKFHRSKNADTDLSIAIISSAIINKGKTIGAIALVCQSSTQKDAQVNQVLLDSLTQLISGLAQNIGQLKTEPDKKNLEQLGNLAKAAGYSSQKELAFAMVNNLCNRTGCDQMSLSSVSNNKVSMVAVSGHDNVSKSSLEIACIIGAMSEAVDMRKTLCYQHDKQNQQLDYRLHRKWHEFAGQGCVASIPLITDGQVNVVISLKRLAHNPFTDKELAEIQKMTETYALAFPLIQKANRSLVNHLSESLRNSVAKTFKPGYWAHKAMLLASLLAITWFIFGTMQYSITVPAKIKPASIRHISAAHNAMLIESNIVEGDIVNKGDILCRFDNQQLQLENNNLHAQLEIANIDISYYTSQADDISLQQSKAKAQLLKAQIEIINNKIAQTVVRAPFDGVIIQGDLRKQIGQTMDIGQPLFQIASDQGWAVELMIPENSITNIRAGLNGILAINARPDIVSELAIQQVAPGATIDQEKNIYICQANIDMDQQWVKSGMEGTAKIQIGPRKPWWIFTHKIIDYIHLNLWL
ncbi:MAG: HlyD family efflux transporter periplasmic adaptor subunit [Phycisphaerae bacterium]|nr:HlyD family efflux transporter periplasmic adaptor subunit [Phycisphaerae bacterium]